MAQSLNGMYAIVDAQHLNLVTDAFRDYLEQDYLVDLYFVCEHNKKVGAHQLVLGTLSHLLRNCLFDVNGRKVEETVYVSVPGIRGKMMHTILQFIYSGRVELPQNDRVEFESSLAQIGIPMSVATKTDNVQTPLIPALGNQSNRDPFIQQPPSMQNQKFPPDVSMPVAMNQNNMQPSVAMAGQEVGPESMLALDDNHQRNMPVGGGVNTVAVAANHQPNMQPLIRSGQPASHLQMLPSNQILQQQNNYGFIQTITPEIARNLSAGPPNFINYDQRSPPNPALNYQQQSPPNPALNYQQRSPPIPAFSPNKRLAPPVVGNTESPKRKKINPGRNIMPSEFINLDDNEDVITIE